MGNKCRYMIFIYIQLYKQTMPLINHREPLIGYTMAYRKSEQLTTAIWLQDGNAKKTETGGLGLNYKRHTTAIFLCLYFALIATTVQYVKWCYCSMHPYLTSLTGVAVYGRGTLCDAIKPYNLCLGCNNDAVNDTNQFQIHVSCLTFIEPLTIHKW